jgi:hypothetical protein
MLTVNAAAASTILVSGSDTHAPGFQPAATYEAHFVGNGNLNRGLSRFVGGSTFIFTDSFLLSPTDLPESAMLESLILDLRPTVENLLSVQKPATAPTGNFTTTRQITSATVQIGRFSGTWAAPIGRIDLPGAGVRADDLDNSPVIIQWTTTVTFAGQPNQPGVRNSDPVYVLRNTGSSLLSAELSGTYAVPEPPAYALIGVGLIAAAARARKSRKAA